MKVVRIRGRKGDAFVVKHGGVFLVDGEVDVESLAPKSLLERLKTLMRETGVEIDPTPYAIDGEMGLRKLMGLVFEEYVYRILTQNFDRVERNRKSLEPIGRIAGRRVHAYPDFVVEGKVAVEAKVGECDPNQVYEYSRVFGIGAVVFPYSGFCRVPKGWRSIPWLVKDPKPLIEFVSRALGR